MYLSPSSRTRYVFWLLAHGRATMQVSLSCPLECKHGSRGLFLGDSVDGQAKVADGQAADYAAGASGL